MNRALSFCSGLARVEKGSRPGKLKTFYIDKNWKECLKNHNGTLSIEDNFSEGLKPSFVPQAYG